MKNIAIFGSGSGTNAENIIQCFAKSEVIRIAVVLSNRKEAGIHVRAARLGVPSFSFSLTQFREGVLILNKLAEFKVDFIVLAGFLPLVSPVIIDAFPNSIINIHPALLPKFGGKGMYGAHVHEAVVAAGETQTGITVHYVNERYDEGAVIFQAVCPVLPSDTADEVATRVHALEYQFFPQVIEQIVTSYPFKESLLVENKLQVPLFCYIFEQTIKDYHRVDDVDAPNTNPYKVNSLKYYLYNKNWIDAVQWHLEDKIRDPDINPVVALMIKRRIDKSNQDRTDLVELIDDFFLQLYKEVTVMPDATINTESPAWAIDRLSILALKVYHIQRETERTDVSNEHIEACNRKLGILLEQKKDLSIALEQLFDDIESGRKYMKVYKQLKMYNDPSLNPVLYNQK